MAKMYIDGEGASSLGDLIASLSEMSADSNSLEYESMFTRRELLFDLCYTIAGAKVFVKETCTLDIWEFEWVDLKETVDELLEILALKRVSWYEPESHESDDGCTYHSVKLHITY